MTLTRWDIEDASGVCIAHDGDLFVVRHDALLRVDPRSGKSKKVVPLKYGGVVASNATHVFAGEDKKALAIALGKKPKVAQKMSASGEGPCCIAPSPDGRFVLVVGIDEGGTLKCFELGKPRALWTIGSVRYAQAVWTPDGKRFVTASSDWNARVKVHDASSKGATVLDLHDPHGPGKPDEPGPSISGFVMDPSGDRVWFGSKLGIASLALAEGAKPDWIVRDRNVTCMALDGTRLIAGTESGWVLVVDRDKREVLETLPTNGPVVDVDARGGHIAAAIEGAIFYR
jgi:hypothetical protein